MDQQTDHWQGQPDLYDVCWWGPFDVVPAEVPANYRLVVQQALHLWQPADLLFLRWQPAMPLLHWR